MAWHGMAAVYTQEELRKSILVIVPTKRNNNSTPSQAEFSQGETLTTGIAIEKRDELSCCMLGSY
jgi:hypothetical protein